MKLIFDECSFDWLKDVNLNLIWKQGLWQIDFNLIWGWGLLWRGVRRILEPWQRDDLLMWADRQPEKKNIILMLMTKTTITTATKTMTTTTSWCEPTDSLKKEYHSDVTITTASTTTTTTTSWSEPTDNLKKEYYSDVDDKDNDNNCNDNNDLLMWADR